MFEFQSNVPLQNKTSFRIGGLARWYAAPADEGEIRAAVDHARSNSLPVLVLGRGSNVLISDAGWPGLVIDIAASFSAISWDGPVVTAQAGARLDALVQEAVFRGCAGLQELSGIPGSVGGAVVMNAGAFGTCIADTIEKATYLTMDDRSMVTLAAAELGFGYRKSVLQTRKAVVLSAQFRLMPGDAGKLRQIRSGILEKRRDKQPLDLPNCGSVFMRPPGNFAGTLIEQAGLKGLRNGNAEISTRHANFIVNLGGATAAEVRHLIVVAQRTVFEQSGILLEPEVVFAGEFEEPLFKPETMAAE